MAETLIVPPSLVPRIREGTYGLLVAAAETIVQSAHVHGQPEPVSCANLEHAFAVLGQIGWTGEQDTEEAIELAPEHSKALHASIEMMLPLLTEWFDELDPDDASRPRRSQELLDIRQLAVGFEGTRGEPHGS